MVDGNRWKAEPGTRMAELLRATAVPLGLVTNGERWMLVHALKDETTGFASWYADLWLDEPQTLRAFASLLGVERFFGVAEERRSPPSEGERSESAGGHRQARATGARSCRAVGPGHRPHRQGARARTASRLRRAQLYEAALTVMMRLVFLLSAEERELLRLGDPV